MSAQTARSRTFEHVVHAARAHVRLQPLPALREASVLMSGAPRLPNVHVHANESAHVHIHVHAHIRVRVRDRDRIRIQVRARVRVHVGGVRASICARARKCVCFGD